MRVRMPLRLGSAVLLLSSLLIAAPAGAAEFDVEVQDFQFAPEELFVNAGDTVNWTWVGDAPHNVTPVEDGAFPASETQTEGTHSATFAEPTEIPYFCTIHASPDGSEGMVGVVNVLPEGEPLPEPGPEPRPAPDPQVLPDAADAIGTALVWSSLFADDGAPTVALGRSDVFADSLTSGAVQGLVDGPLLLTPSDSLDPRVADEMTRLGVERVIVFGGEQAISADVEQQLRDLGYTVDRVQGITRIETANAAAETFFPDATDAFLVRSDGTPGGDPSQGFADSLAVGGAAASASIPILLSETAQLSTTTRTYLQASQITTVYVVGGVAALSEQVEADLVELGITVVRLAGDSRFDTNEAVILEFYDFPPTAILVDGQGPDAWVSGFAAASAAESAPIVLANGDDLPPWALEAFAFGIQSVCGPGVSSVACEHAQIAATSIPFGFPGTQLAVMTGEEEVPGPGVETGSGDFALRPTDADDAICYEIATYGLEEPLAAAHIHQAPEGEAGDVVIPLDIPEGDETFVASCAFDLDPALVADIAANPADYYANFHTAAFPAGAVRGQLFNADVIGLTEMTSGAEVPPVDIGGGGFAFLIADADDHSRLAYYLSYFLEDGSQAVAAHIHEAPEGENGPVVQPLVVPTAGSPEEGYEGTFLIEGVDPALVDDLLADPSGYYVNLHTEAFPDGALRGQLFDPFAGPPPGPGGPPPEEEEPLQAAFAATRQR